jgi:hypothetical protein
MHVHLRWGKVRIHATVLWSIDVLSCWRSGYQFWKRQGLGLCCSLNNEEEGEQQDWSLHICVHIVAAMVALLVEF